MRVHVTMIACVAVGAAVSLLGSPAAAADDESFAREARSLGMYHAADNLISTARSACYMLSRNRDPGQVEERVQRYTLATPDQSRAFFVLAVREFCPQFSGAVGV